MRYKEITEIKKIVAAWHSSHIEVYAAYRGIIDNALKGALTGKKIFKLFRNSNTPLVLCAQHIKETAEAVQEEE